MADEYFVKQGKIYRNGVYVADSRSSEPKGHGPLIALFVVTTVILALILALVLLIEAPWRETPVITVLDDDGYWGEGKIAVFDGKVYPGRNGSYSFIIENPNEAELSYSFRIQGVYNDEVLSGEDEDVFPLLFRLKMNNAYIETTDWLTIKELRYDKLNFLEYSSQSFILEWKWPFENGQDDFDTLYGASGGEMALTLTLTAEATK